MDGKLDENGFPYEEMMIDENIDGQDQSAIMAPSDYMAHIKEAK
jgi:hypothetical protein